MQIFINKPMMKIYCISSYFSFVICHRRDRQKAFFEDIFPQKAKPQLIVFNGLFAVNFHQS